MTAPLSVLLQQLEEALAKGTPGVWGSYWGDHIGSGVVWTTPNGSGVTVEHDICKMQDEDDRACTDNADNPASPEADAELIVAAVNALPELIAALRAVDRITEDLLRPVEHTVTHYRDGLRDAAREIRDALAAVTEAGR